MEKTKQTCATSIFNYLASSHCSDELLGESLKVLAEESQNFETKTKELGYFKDGKATELVFSICKKLDLPLEVKYVAVEIFDQFMTTHVTELREIVKSSSSTEKQLDWNSVEVRIRDQVTLRAMTCVQVASKMVSHYKAVPSAKIKKYLSACNLQYSISSVVKSELRVLRTLDFRLSFTTPLTHIEMLLEVLQRNCPGFEVSMVHTVSTKILDVAYLQKSHLFQLLSYASGSQLNAKSANDQFLMATCVIVAAAYIIDASTNDVLIEQIALITCLDEADIIMYSTMLVKLSLDLQ